MARDADFADFAHARWGALVRLAVVLGCTHHQAEDAAQQTLTNCLLKWRAVSSSRDPVAYTNRMLINLVKDGWKRRRLELRFLETAARQEVYSDRPDYESKDQLMRAIRGLSIEHREVLALRYYLDYSEAMIAETLALPRGTVKSRLSRALAQVEKAVSQTEVE